MRWFVGGGGGIVEDHKRSDLEACFQEQEEWEEMNERCRELFYQELQANWVLSEEETARLREVDFCKLTLLAFLLRSTLVWFDLEEDGRFKNLIAQAVRCPAPIYQGRSMLDLVLDGKIGEVIDETYRIM